MNQQLSHKVFASPHDSFVGGNDLKPRYPASEPPSLEELAHELRQPLSVIDSLAYYLELISADENMCAQLQRIQAMVIQVDRILERNCPSRALAVEAAS